MKEAKEKRRKPRLFAFIPSKNQKTRAVGAVGADNRRIPCGSCSLRWDVYHRMQFGTLIPHMFSTRSTSAAGIQERCCGAFSLLPVGKSSNRLETALAAEKWWRRGEGNGGRKFVIRPLDDIPLLHFIRKIHNDQTKQSLCKIAVKKVIRKETVIDSLVLLSFQDSEDFFNLV